MQSIASVYARPIAASFPAARAVSKRGASSSDVRLPVPMKNARQVVGIAAIKRRGVIVRAEAGEQGSTKATETPTIAQLAPPEATANTTAVIAEAAAPAAPIIDSGDTAWMLTSTALVLAMNIPGLSMFYGGLVGKKNVLSIFASCMALTCFMSLMWFSFGYSLSFGSGNAFIGDFSKIFLGGVSAMSNAVGTIPEPLWVMFQSTFAVIAPGLIIGAFAERMKFSAMLIFSAVWSVLVYYPFAHMVWGGGFLEHLGILDFAGGIVVHLTAGAAALLTCIMIGPRKSGPVEPHNLPMMITGTGILWVGWFGFNAGSAVAANAGAAMAMVATMAAAAAGGATWMLLDWWRDGKPATLGLCCGVVAGLVCVTPGAGFVSPMGAAIMGIMSGAICRWASTTMKEKLGYDDALDVWGVHGMGGLLGNELTAIFGATQFGGTEIVASVPKLFAIHTASSVFAIAWSMAATFVILKAIDATIGLRPSEAGEMAGLDASDHGEVGYILSDEEDEPPSEMAPVEKVPAPAIA